MPLTSPLRVPSRATVRLLAAGLAALVVVGCAQVATRPTAPTTPTAPPVDRDAVRQAAELARSGAALAGAARRTNDAEIERLVARLDDASLQREASALPAGDPLYPYLGRALIQRGLPLPRPFEREGWDFGDRPAAERDGYRPPVRMAVLLPLSGSLSSAARPVRDGLLAGYYGEGRRRPDIRFYDTAGTPSGALAAYDRAAGDGVDFIVGPLGRDEVGALFARGTLPVTTLALNRGTQATPRGHASFSLSPEDEGIAAAEFLLDRGARNVLVIAGDDDTQRRAVAAFRENLTARGGTVAATLDASTTDFAAQATVDGVFIATRGNTARAIAPRLASAGLGGKPRAATSQLLAGTGKVADDRALDGIAFPSETWITRAVRSLPVAETAGARLPTARGAAGRLFAFGYDAWLLTAYLDHLGRSGSASLEGATGVLRVDGFGNVLRTPAWSTFRDGEPAPLADAAR